MQSMVAFVNLATYYGVGIPFGFILINIFSFGVKVHNSYSSILNCESRGSIKRRLGLGFGDNFGDRSSVKPS